jgi:FkbM family methyltransferase
MLRDVGESSLKQIDGLWWPTSDQHAHTVLPGEAVVALETVLPHVEQRHVCVQAGGNAGVWPLRLADYFEKVYTFEPEPLNFECLRRNVTKPNIVATRAALGEKAGSVGLFLHLQNTGGHTIRGKGRIPVVTIDSLELGACDLIWLDIEGYELFALQGAEGTIKRYRPVVVVEVGGLSNNFGIPTGEDGRWLAERNYRHAGQVGRDFVYVPY